MPKLFITATGTEIGKTFITAALARQLQQQGEQVHAIKPIISGLAELKPEETDSAQLLQACNKPTTSKDQAAISPYRYQLPLSPDMAARLEERPLPYAEMLQFCQQQKQKTPSKDWLLCEGVGGIMVPLDTKHTVLDWIQALAWPNLLITGSYLGSMSHCLSALETLKKHSLSPKIIILNETANSSVSLRETEKSLRNHTEIPILCVPYSTKRGKLPTWSNISIDLVSPIRQALES